MISCDQFWPARRSFEFFRDLLLQHSVQRPPYSIGLFSLQDVKAITDHAATGFFLPFSLILPSPVPPRSFPRSSPCSLAPSLSPSPPLLSRANVDSNSRAHGSALVGGWADIPVPGYFRHYMLYKYAFTKKTEMRFSTVFTHTMSVPESVPPGQLPRYRPPLRTQTRNPRPWCNTDRTVFLVLFSCSFCCVWPCSERICCATQCPALKGRSGLSQALCSRCLQPRYQTAPLNATTRHP